jgi:FAD dependent oxidoreductase TIGR03364
LAHAYAAARRGLRVALFERNRAARGASIRNFGMIWPVGQPPSTLPLALRSRKLWLEILRGAGIPYFDTGSLHAVYYPDEEQVAREFACAAPGLGYRAEWLDRDAALARSAALQPEGLRGALWSATELTVDPRQALEAIPRLLEEKYGVNLQRGATVISTDGRDVRTARGIWQAGLVAVCGGDDFETLYPEVLATSGITRVKLQMMRTLPQPSGWRLGPSLAAGLTLSFYRAFELCPSLDALKRRYAEQMPAYVRWGIHVLVSQTAAGELTLGDSHEYGLEPAPFDRPEIDELILAYLRTFARFPTMSIAERWHGIYAKHPDKPWFHAEPEAGVHIVTALGGAGMTLSFGLGEQNLDNWLG